MIFSETKLNVADNSGAKVVKCIRILNRKNFTVGSFGNLLLIRILKKKTFT